ncbi:MAG: flippase-like domain-containing protein [Merismopedia sp. SIO2A8]|nr:flippase-like domain-containing protein [Merismopedia sp. SIO2A8]
MPTRSISNARNNLFRGLIGILVGVLFFWLALRQTSWTEVSQILGTIKTSWVVGAIAAYITSICIRTTRWQKLMWAMKPLPYRSVALALIVGYAMNNLLPARLGELFRANFAGRRYNIPRSAVIGSIAIERTLDGLIVVLCLVIGRFFIQSNPLLNQVTIAGFVLFVGIFLILLALGHNDQLGHLVWVPEPILKRIRSFQGGLSGLNASLLVPAIALSAIVWLFEMLAQWCILNALGVSLNWQQLLPLIGVVSLSTLIPSPPGFVGTFQYAYVSILGLLGYSSAQGIAAATATQIFLLGTTTLAGLGIFVGLSVLGLVRHRQRSYPTQPASSDSERNLAKK